MKSYIVSLALLAASVAAAPVENAEARGFETMGALSSEMSKRQSLSVERDELSWCRPVTVIFARGTVELGNVGSLVGPPFFNAFGAAIGFQNVGVQGVPYPATIAGYLAGGDQDGARTLAALTQQAFSQCPQSQIVLSGYRCVNIPLAGNERIITVHQSRSAGSPPRSAAATSSYRLQNICSGK